MIMPFLCCYAHVNGSTIQRAFIRLSQMSNLQNCDSDNRAACKRFLITAVRNILVLETGNAEYGRACLVPFRCGLLPMSRTRQIPNAKLARSACHCSVRKQQQTLCKLHAYLWCGAVQKQ